MKHTLLLYHRRILPPDALLQHHDADVKETEKLGREQKIAKQKNYRLAGTFTHNRSYTERLRHTREMR